MRLLPSSPWSKLLLIALGILLLAPLSSKLPDGLEFTLHKLGITTEPGTEQVSPRAGE